MKKVNKRFPADAFCVFATIVAEKQMTPNEKIDNLAKACGCSPHVVKIRLKQAKACGIVWKGLEGYGKRRKTVALTVISKRTAPSLKRLIARTRRKLREKVKA